MRIGCFFPLLQFPTRADEIEAPVWLFDGIRWINWIQRWRCDQMLICTGKERCRAPDLIPSDRTETNYSTIQSNVMNLNLNLGIIRRNSVPLVWIVSSIECGNSGELNQESDGFKTASALTDGASPRRLVAVLDEGCSLIGCRRERLLLIGAAAFTNWPLIVTPLKSRGYRHRSYTSRLTVAHVLTSRWRHPQLRSALSTTRVIISFLTRKSHGHWLVWYVLRMEDSVPVELKQFEQFKHRNCGLGFVHPIRLLTGIQRPEALTHSPMSNERWIHWSDSNGCYCINHHIS